MRFFLLCTAALAALLVSQPSAGAMSKKQDVTVRFHSEANRNDSEAFAIPVNLIYQRRQAYLSRVPDFSEKQIERILPFQARDGSWGCIFKLTSQGRLRLETMSGEIRGSAFVIFIGTKMGNRQVADMIIDRPVTDGIVTVPRGLNEFEIAMLKKNFKLIGAPTKQNWRDKPKDHPPELPGGRFDHPKDYQSPYEAISSTPRGRSAAEPPLPRLGD